ncbi:Protein of unknown function [Mariniphaga anaerophila]|uniref:DUF3408 domain-containing protein n=1 Tax=Mariniphaga anaerophila TaxID=1484053 RepID=A0A1M4U1W3_9BACT|nr:DUF3408 domain-containing protein [Mariniphaga anaerophila]SHE50801.1 Protein of unknown function [Mariniphaga anaerophila]
MVRKKYNSDEIDEEYLISTINNEKPVAEQKKETTQTPKQAPRKRKQKEVEYTELFIRQSDSKARSGKLVAIRPEFHERILKIVRVIGNDDITIFNYIDNVLRYHFDEFQEEITKNYRAKNTDIF